MRYTFFLLFANELVRGMRAFMKPLACSASSSGHFDFEKMRMNAFKKNSFILLKVVEQVIQEMIEG